MQTTITQRRKVQALATWLFMAPIFLQRAFIGGEGDSYTDYQGISLVGFGYVSHFGLLAIAIWQGIPRNKKISNIFILLATTAAASIFHLIATSSVTGYPLSEIVIPLGRGWLWLLAIAIYGTMFFDETIFVGVFLSACRTACWISLLSLAIYLITGVAFGTHIARGYPRVQGLFSEPSALAAVIPAFLIYSILNRRPVDSFIGAAAALMSASVIVYLTVFFLLIVFGANSLRWPKTSKSFIYAFATAVVLAPILLTAENSSAISEFAGQLANSIGSDQDDAQIFQVFIGRLLSTVAALSGILGSYSIDNVGGGLARLIGTFITLDELRLNDQEYFGMGLNVYGYLSVKQYDDIFDFGYFPFLLSSFGIPATIILITLLTKKVGQLIDHAGGIGTIFCGALFGTLNNSAGGLHAYALPMLATILAITNTAKPLSAMRWRKSSVERQQSMRYEDKSHTGRV